MEQSKKNLPIRIFEKRKIDIRETEGGGGGDPSWVLSGEELIEHSANIFNDFIQAITLDDEGNATKEPLIPLSVKFKPKAFAKSHRGDIEKVFSDKKGEYASIAFSHEQGMVFALKSSNHIDFVKSNITNAERNPKGVSAIESISQYKPYVESDLKLKDALKIKLLRFGDADIYNQVEMRFKLLCEDYNILLKVANYSPSQRIYKASNVTTDSLDKIKKFKGVMSVSSMPKYATEFTSNNSMPTISIRGPVDTESYPIVGLLDSGVENIAHLAPWKIGGYSNYIDEVLDKKHGTFVAGILTYGDELICNNSSRHNKCKIFDAAVIGDEDLGGTDEDALSDNIREIVEIHGKDIKIWNLSLGSKKEASLNYFSDFAHFLDKIQQSHNIIIVKSAGNCENYKKGMSQSRITESGDSVLSVVVGSIAHTKSSTDIAHVNTLSPFSRIGPGPQGIIKPDVVHYGGNSGLNSEGYTINSGVYSFDTNGQLTDMIGTSFAAPRISALIANLNNTIGGNFNELLLKTLTIHSAKHPDAINGPINEALNKYGFGFPLSVDDIVYNDDNEITLILQETLPKKQYIEILDFPFPEQLVNGNFYTGEITLTLLCQPILDDSEIIEYIQSHVDVKFGTYDEETKRDTTKNTVKNEIGKKNSKNLLNKTLFQKKSSKPILIEGGEYKVVKKYKIDLSEVTQANKDKHLKYPKKWYLQIKGFYRHKIEMNAQRNNDELEQQFCLAITIRDTSNSSAPIYNYVTKELDNKQFIHNKIQLYQSIKVK